MGFKKLNSYVNGALCNYLTMTLILALYLNLDLALGSGLLLIPLLSINTSLMLNYTYCFLSHLQDKHFFSSVFPISAVGFFCVPRLADLVRLSTETWGSVL